MKNKDRPKREWCRSGKTNKHHIVNECNGGRKEPWNILRMDTARHAAWHFLFGNMDFEEVASLLLRCKEMKENQRT